MSLDKKPTTIASMFDSVAPRYDLMNDIMTAFAHRYTRNATIRILLSEPVKGVVLDLATGTGDMGIMLTACLLNKAKVVGVDFSPVMLTGAIAKMEQQRIPLNLLVGEISQLPIPDNYVDACVISYGIRNVHDIPRVLKEILRVIKPGGKLLILEATPPPSRLLRTFADFYFSKIAHHLAKAFASDQQSYKYLASSIRQFPSAKEFTQILEKVGWASIKYHPLLLGIVTVFECTKSR
jgi:demethylmenaquinone methyltransferase/2-methoxy-6-polyprenyl-1,4-benzoquinol methylase